jgi:uncharacterized protein YkwD
MRPSLVPIILLSFVATVAAYAETPASSSTSAVQRRVLELVNDARADSRHCGRDHFAPTTPLRASNPLREAAKVHARDMARRSYFDHQAPGGDQPRDRVRRTGYQWKLIGENIAFGPESAEEVVAGWLASPGHCANIMDPRFQDMGVAVAKGRKRGHFYWVQEFGQPAR